MEGITILSTIKDVVWTDGTAIIFIVLMTITLLFGLIAIFVVEWNYDCGIVMLSIAAIILIGAIITGIFGPKEPYIKHQVLIDKSVSMTEFHNKYILLEHDGEIYTITEKELSK